MLKDTNQMTMDLSPYQGLYEAIIPQDHILRKLKDNIDFSFVNPMLRKQYCESFGRPAKEPEMMFIAIFKIKAYSRMNGTNLHSRDRRKFCVIDVPRQYENLRLSQE